MFLSQVNKQWQEEFFMTVGGFLKVQRCFSTDDPFSHDELCQPRETSTFYPAFDGTSPQTHTCNFMGSAH